MSIRSPLFAALLPLPTPEAGGVSAELLREQPSKQAGDIRNRIAEKKRGENNECVVG